MQRPLLLPVILLSLVACSPPPAPGATPAPSSGASGAVSAPPTPPVAAEATPPAPPQPVAVAPAGSAIEGSIREGNRPPPALRVCAHPLDGGTPTCIDTEAGATSYRIDIAAGRYVVDGQALDDPAMKFAHAERIRCIRAPCPPDTAKVVEVRAGTTASGIDLSPGGALPPG